jgi:phage terminase large subunit
MLMYYDDDLLEPKDGVSFKLARWQIELLNYFARNHKYKEAPIEAMLCAANGSGKSQFIIAPLVIWFILKYDDAQAMITNASGAQLNSGNLRHATRLANKINTFHKKDFPNGVLDCQFRKITNNFNGSVCDMFATDEPGKVEGKHPLKVDGKFLIIVDEGKSVADEIFDALLRSHDYTHKLVVSSSGTTSGVFYQDWHNPKLTHVLKKRVTVHDCPYIPQSVIDDLIARKGRNHPLVRSSLYSEFTSAESQVVITRENLQKCALLCKTWYPFGPLRAGLDLAAGGDESVISVWSGNKQVGMQVFDNKDTSKTVREVIDYVNSFDGKLKSENVYADDGGVGRGILDNFREKGYVFRRILNNGKPWDTTHYANRGTELWWNFRRFVEEYQVLFMLDAQGNIEEKLFDQLQNRYYKIQDSSGKVILESKQKAKAEGHPSPDRADAVVLAWSPYTYPNADITGALAPKIERRGISPAEIEDQLRSTDRAKLLAALNGETQRGIIPARLTEAQLSTQQSYGHKQIFNRSQKKFYSKYGL